MIAALGLALMAIAGSAQANSGQAPGEQFPNETWSVSALFLQASGSGNHTVDDGNGGFAQFSYTGGSNPTLSVKLAPAGAVQSQPLFALAEFDYTTLLSADQRVTSVVQSDAFAAEQYSGAMYIASGSFSYSSSDGQGFVSASEYTSVIGGDVFAGGSGFLGCDDCTSGGSHFSFPLFNVPFTCPPGPDICAVALRTGPAVVRSNLSLNIQNANGDEVLTASIDPAYIPAPDFLAALNAADPNGPLITANDFSITNSLGTGGVPEPASWALMILGFGAAGAMVRNRRRAVRLAA